MLAVVKQRSGPGAEVIAVDRPAIGANDVLVKTRIAAISHLDVRIWEWDQWTRSRITKLPLVLGHEFAGNVVEFGKEVTTVTEGDHVSAESHIPCGSCYLCRTNRMHLCHNMQLLGVDRNGVFTEYASIPETNIWKNNPELDLRIATIQKSLLGAVQAVFPEDKVEDVAGKNVAVFGYGPLSLMTIAVLRTSGAANIIAVAEIENKMCAELATKVGADSSFSIDGEEENMAETMLDAAGIEGVDVVLELSGTVLAVKRGFEILNTGGRVSLAGSYTEPVLFDFSNYVIRKSATMYGIPGRSRVETRNRLMNLLSNNDFRKKILSIITHTVPISEIGRGINLIRSKQAAKVILEPIF